MDKAQILVVEDESVTALDIRAQLEDLGYAVPATVFSGQEAIKAAEATQPDLVLMDIHLRGAMDGIEAAQHIHDHLDIPIVYLTAFADESTIQRAKAAEPFGYLLKPFEEKALHSTIEMALYKHRMDRQRTEFLAMVSHDIRNPLGLIMGYTEMLEEEVSTHSTAETDRLLQRLKATTVTLHALVTNYLDVSRIEAGHVTLAKKPLQIATLLQQLRRQYEAEIQRRQVQLKLVVEDQLPELTADHMAIERVLSNLLSNAFKFTPQGGCITLSACHQDQDIVVTVKDTGPGIPASDIPFLFEKYRRTTATQPQQGVGLGLYIVKTFVEAHGGHVAVESHPDHPDHSGYGTCFSVFLPIEAHASEAIGLH